MGTGVIYTTDEEVGRGTEHFDVDAFGADYAYTLDGSDLGEIEETVPWSRQSRWTFRRNDEAAARTAA